MAGLWSPRLSGWSGHNDSHRKIDDRSITMRTLWAHSLVDEERGERKRERGEGVPVQDPLESPAKEDSVRNSRSKWPIKMSTRFEVVSILSLTLLRRFAISNSRPVPHNTSNKPSLKPQLQPPSNCTRCSFSFSVAPSLFFSRGLSFFHADLFPPAESKLLFLINVGLSNKRFSCSMFCKALSLRLLLAGFVRAQLWAFDRISVTRSAE